MAEAVKASWARTASVTTGLIAGNFIYQGFQAHPDWGSAIERSWSEWFAVATLALVTWIDRKD